MNYPYPRPITVKLSKPEMYAARQGANLRYQLARTAGLIAKTRDDRAPQDLEYLGICAEMAVAKIFQIPYDPTRMGFDAGVDIWLGNTGIDVKATFYESGKLLFVDADAFKADAAILVTATAEPDQVRVVGGITKQLYFTYCTEIDLGKGKCLAVGQERLTCLRDIWRASVMDRIWGNI